MKIDAVGFLWDGGAMIPLERYRGLASRQFRPGVEYALVPHRERSDAAHGLFFKCCELAWKNLPEEVAPRFPTSEHLRRWALIKEGFADEHTMLCSSEAQAQSTGVLARSLDGYAVIQIDGPIVRVWTAKSQSRHAMGHDAFIDSMNKTMERMADMLGISSAQLAEEAKSAMVRKGAS